MRTRRTVLPVIAASVLLALAGCGSQPSAPPAPSTEHGGFAHCLNEHGVTESTVSPAGPPAGVDQDTWDKAMKACSSLAPGPS